MPAREEDLDGDRKYPNTDWWGVNWLTNTHGQRSLSYLICPLNLFLLLYFDCGSHTISNILVVVMKAGNLIMHRHPHHFAYLGLMSGQSVLIIVFNANSKYINIDDLLVSEIFLLTRSDENQFRWQRLYILIYPKRADQSKRVSF